MSGIITVLERLDFEQQADGTYIGKGANTNPNSVIKFEIQGSYLICYKDGMILFQIHYTHLKIGTFLVILQSFYIFHERYVYEVVEGIEERFEETED